MPLYEYRCTKCEHEFEQTNKMDSPNPPCPKQNEGTQCGCDTVKLVSKSSFYLKGGGWYNDGYGKSN